MQERVFAGEHPHGITGSPALMNKAITVGGGGSASDAGGGGGGGGGGGAGGPSGPSSPSSAAGSASSSSTSAAAGPSFGAQLRAALDRLTGKKTKAGPPVSREERAKAKKMVAHLDKKVQKDVEKSPTLQKQLADLHDKKWTVGYRADGGQGAECDRVAKEIRLDKNWGKNNSAALAHEVGHAEYTPKPDSPPNATDTKQSYVDRNVKNHFDDEGAATYNNCKARDEIHQNSGGKRDIGVLGQNSASYQQTYDQSKTGNPTQQQAQEQMGQGYKTENTGNTNPPQSYNDYYGKYYSDKWDQTHPGAGSGGGGP